MLLFCPCNESMASIILSYTLLKCRNLLAARFFQRSRCRPLLSLKYGIRLNIYKPHVYAAITTYMYNATLSYFCHLSFVIAICFN